MRSGATVPTGGIAMEMIDVKQLEERAAELVVGEVVAVQSELRDTGKLGVEIMLPDRHSGDC
jgi:hypothetical protein